jgi:hypothetical protein
LPNREIAGIRLHVDATVEGADQKKIVVPVGGVATLVEAVIELDDAGLWMLRVIRHRQQIGPPNAYQTVQRFVCIIINGSVGSDDKPGGHPRSFVGVEDPVHCDRRCLTCRCVRAIDKGLLKGAPGRKTDIHVVVKENGGRIGHR